MTKDSEITKVQVIIRRFLWETRNVVKTPEESQKWLSKFRNTLEFQDLEELPSEYAMLLLAEAKSFNNTKKRNAQMKWVRDSLVREGIKRPTQDQLDERWLEMYGNEENPQDAPNGNAGVDRKSATSCDQLTADGDTREDSLDEKSGTSANNYGPRQAKNGDAATREGAEAVICRESGVAWPTTVSKNVSTPTISTNRRRTGGSSLSQTSSLPPVRQSEPDVLSLAYSGEFGNVRLTQEQYNELGIRFGNLAKLNRAIDSLSCQIENGEKNPKNHYAELVKWANYRDDMDEAEEVKAAKQPHYETVSEHNARIVAEGKKWIDEHFPKKDNKNG